MLRIDDVIVRTCARARACVCVCVVVKVRMTTGSCLRVSANGCNFDYSRIGIMTCSSPPSDVTFLK